MGGGGVAFPAGFSSFSIFSNQNKEGVEGGGGSGPLPLISHWIVQYKVDQLYACKVRLQPLLITLFYIIIHKFYLARFFREM